LHRKERPRSIQPHLARSGSSSESIRKVWVPVAMVSSIAKWISEALSALTWSVPDCARARDELSDRRKSIILRRFIVDINQSLRKWCVFY
jgi:hypothetical protein